MRLGNWRIRSGGGSTGGRLITMSTGILITRISVWRTASFAGFIGVRGRTTLIRIRLTKASRSRGMPLAEGATELHIVGGLNSKLPFEYYTDLFSSLKREFPALHLKALTMVELDFFARFYKMSDEDVIEKLKAAGMDSCPGGGAEIFAEPTRSRICDHKCDGNRWLELSGKVHNAGLKTNATMLYGHIESIEDRIDHFVKLREQQDKTGGFQCFIPLAFYPPGTALSSLPGPDAIDNLKTIAVSRLMLDNFEHIKAYWVMLGKQTAQTALHFGANDLDGTITDGGELTHSYADEGEVKMSKAGNYHDDRKRRI